MERERKEKERLEKERIERERRERERQEKLERERLEKERKERERRERERQEKLEREERERKEKLEREKRERQEKERLERERQRIEREKREKERLDKERKEKERLERERIERERNERLQLEKIEREKREKLRLIQVERERKEKERIAKLEKERLERERREQERLENERIEKERLERERREQERKRRESLEKERKEKERLERERREKEQMRLEKIRLEKERIKNEQLRLEKIRIESERLKREKMEKERIEKLRLIQIEKERKEKLERERREKERREKEEKEKREKLERERLKIAEKNKISRSQSERVFLIEKEKKKPYITNVKYETVYEETRQKKEKTIPKQKYLLKAIVEDLNKSIEIQTGSLRYFSRLISIRPIEIINENYMEYFKDERDSKKYFNKLIELKSYNQKEMEKYETTTTTTSKYYKKVIEQKAGYSTSGTVTNRYLEVDRTKSGEKSLDKNNNITSSYYKQPKDKDYNIKAYKSQEKDREDNNYNRSTYFKENKYEKSNEKIKDNRQLNKTLSKDSKSEKKEYKYIRKTYDKEGKEANTIYNQYSKNSKGFNTKPQYETNKIIETKYTKISYTKEGQDNNYRNKNQNVDLNEEKYKWKASDKKDSSLVNYKKGGIREKYSKNNLSRYTDDNTEESKTKKFGYSVQYEQGIKQGSKSYMNQSINNLYKYKESNSTSTMNKIPQSKSSYSFIKEKSYKDNIMTKNYSIDDDKDKNKNKYINSKIAYKLKEKYYKADAETEKREKERREKEEKERKERERLEKLRSQEKEKIRSKIIKEEKERIEREERLSKEKLEQSKKIPKIVGDALRSKYYETERNEEKQKSKDNIYNDSKGNKNSKLFIKNIVIYPDPKSNIRNSNEAKDSLLTSVSSVNQSINKFLVQSVEEESVSESSSRMSKRPTYKSKRYNIGQNKFKESDSTLSKSKIEEIKYKKMHKSNLQSPRAEKALNNINTKINNDLSESQNNVSIKEKYFKKEYQLTETPKRKFMFKFSNLEDPVTVHPKGDINNGKYIGDKKTKLYEKNIFIKSYDDFGESLNDNDKYSAFNKTAKNKYENIMKNTGYGDGKTQKYFHKVINVSFEGDDYDINNLDLSSLKPDMSEEVLQNMIKRNKSQGVSKFEKKNYKK